MAMRPGKPKETQKESSAPSSSPQPEEKKKKKADPLEEPAAKKSKRDEAGKTEKTTDEKDQPDDEMMEEDGSEAWDSIFGGQSAEREQAYHQMQLSGLLHISWDGEREQPTGGFPTEGLVAAADNYRLYTNENPMAPRELADHFSTRNSSIGHNTRELHKVTRLPKYVVSLFCSAFETGVMIGGAPTEASKKPDLFIDPEYTDTFDPCEFIVEGTSKTMKDVQAEEHARDIRHFTNKYFKAVGQLLMAVVVNSFSRAHVIMPGKADNFNASSANSEIATKAKAAIRMAMEALAQVSKSILGEEPEEAEIDDELLIKLFYSLSKSLSRRSLAYKQVIQLRLKEGRLQDLRYYPIYGWKVAEVDGMEGEHWVRCNCFLPLNEDSKNRFETGRTTCVPLRAAKKIASSAPIGGLLIPSVKAAVAGYTAALATSALDPFVTIPGVVEEQPSNSTVNNFVSALADSAMRTATRKLQSLHAGIIEGETSRPSLFRSHRKATEDHPELSRLGIVIGAQMAASKDDLPAVTAFLKLIKKKIGAEAEGLDASRFVLLGCFPCRSGLHVSSSVSSA